MGGVAVLHPKDLFNNTNRHHNFIYPASMKTHTVRRNPLPHPAPAPVNRSSLRRKRSPPKNPSTNHHNTTTTTTKLNTNTPLIGQVKILKRGEALPPPPPTLDLKVEKQNQQQVNKTSVKKIGSFDDGVSQNNSVVSTVEPGVVPKKQIRISDCYAGWAFISSPPPSSLPVPAFFKNRNLILTDDSNSNNTDEATSDILKLLRLDLS